MEVCTVTNPSVAPAIIHPTENSDINLNIIDINIGKSIHTVVDAHELHDTMHIRMRFSTWMTERLSRMGFRENEDYIIFYNRNDGKKRGRPFKCYFIGVDMAQALAAYEKTVRSMQVRDYISSVLEKRRNPVPSFETSPATASEELKRSRERAKDRKTVQSGSTEVTSTSDAMEKSLLSTQNSRKPMTALVRELSRKGSLPLDIVYAAINRQFGISSITRLPQERVGEVMEWLRKEIDICESERRTTDQDGNVIRRSCGQILEKAEMLLSTSYTRRPVTTLVRELCSRAGLPLDIIYRAINRQFKIGSITRLPQDRVGEVVEWLQEEIDICKSDQKAFKASYVKEFLSHIPIRFLKHEDLLCLEAVRKAEKAAARAESQDRTSTPAGESSSEAVEKAPALSGTDPMSASTSGDSSAASTHSDKEEPFDFWNPPSTHISLSSMMRILGFRTYRKFVNFCSRYISEIIKLPCGTSRMIACDQHDEDWYHRDLLFFLMEKRGIKVVGHA